MTERPCVCITGPTACGKTDLALRLSESFPLEIVSMDSAMVYRGMDIGTAKPAPEVREAVRHHLIDVADPAESYSAGRFAREAGDAISDIRARGRVPLIVGGTLLYLRALRDGLAELPAADPDVRRRLDEEAETSGWERLHQRLASVDSAAAERISASDRQRIQRALEVYEITGIPMTELQERGGSKETTPVRSLAMIPDDRTELAQRIERRFDEMVDAGFVEEVKSLMQRTDLDALKPAMRAVGYRQIWAHLEGEWDWATAREKALTATRQLAKRQMTWLRSDESVEFLTSDADAVVDIVAGELRAAGA